MGCIPRSTAQNRKWLDGQSSMPRPIGKDIKSIRIFIHIRHCAGRRCNIKRLCSIHVVTTAA